MTTVYTGKCSMPSGDHVPLFSSTPKRLLTRLERPSTIITFDENNSIHPSLGFVLSPLIDLNLPK